jgi:hypothetical protein
MKNKHSKLLPTKKYDIPSWYWFLLDVVSQIRPNIQTYIKILNLIGISSFEDVQSNIYIILFNLDKSGKLTFQPENKTFTYIKQDGSKNKIKNFKAWCKTISFNYLKQIRKERNKIDSDANIDDEYFLNKVCTDTIMSHLDYKEVKDKIKLLKKLDRRIIELCFFEGYKFEEISNRLEEEEFGIFTTVALRQRKCRALEKLRKHFLPRINN